MRSFRLTHTFFLCHRWAIAGGVAIAITLLSACGFTPTIATKSEYFEKYRDFLSKIEQSHRIYDNRDWEKNDAIFNEYAALYFHQFLPEMNFGERIEASRLSVTYQLYRYKAMVNRQVQDVYRPEAQALMESLTAINDSTAQIFKDFDNNLRQLLDEVKQPPPSKNN